MTTNSFSMALSSCPIYETARITTIKIKAVSGAQNLPDSPAWSWPPDLTSFCLQFPFISINCYFCVLWVLSFPFLGYSNGSFLFLEGLKLLLRRAIEPESWPHRGRPCRHSIEKYPHWRKTCSGNLGYSLPLCWIIFNSSDSKIANQFRILVWLLSILHQNSCCIRNICLRKTEF